MVKIFNHAEALAQSPVQLAWGFGGSAMQMEGAWNQDGKGPSVFDHAYADHSAHPTHGTPYRAADHYNKYKSDLAFLSELGATAYRFSVSWPRILPDCTGPVNAAGIKYYSDYIDEILKNGAEPFLTMFHWDLLQACQDKFSGFQSDKIIDAFAFYANILLENFGDRRNSHHLQLLQILSIISVCIIHLLAHATIVQNARKMPNSAKWKFSLPSITDWIDPDPASGGSVADVYSSTLLQTEWYFDPCFFGDYGDGIKSLYPLPQFTDAQKAMLKGSCDFIAVNMYNSLTSNLPAEPPSETTQYNAQEVDDKTALTYWPHPRPEGTRLLPKFLYNRFQKEVVITELGYHVPRTAESTFDQAVNDNLRVQYWQLNGPQLLRLIRDDQVPLTAVLAWSLIDNYEFETYEFRWGHIAIDYWDPATGLVNTEKGSLKRQPKLSALYMKEFFSNNTVSPFIRSTTESSSSTQSTAFSTISLGSASGPVETTSVANNGPSRSNAFLVEAANFLVALFFII